MRLSQIERWHFWFVARRRLLGSLLRIASPRGFARVLDVGSGTGTNARFLGLHARRVVGLDLRPEGLGTELHPTHSNAVFVQGSATSLPFASGAFDAVTVLDVLEHVDDEGALREIRRVLRPGGAIVMSVPAMPWLWSYRDIDAGHLRRYERRQLTELMRKSRLELRALHYYQCLLFPLVLARTIKRKSRSLRDLEEAPGPVLNAVLGWVSRAEVTLDQFVPWPFGSSLVGLCRKPEHD